MGNSGMGNSAMGTTIDTDTQIETRIDTEPPHPPAGLTLRRIQWLLAGLLVLFLLWSISLAQAVILPVALGVLIALTLSPPVRWLRRRGLPTPFSAVLIVGSIGITVATGLYLLRYPAQMLITRAPEIRQELQLKLWSVARNIEKLKEASDQMRSLAGGSPLPGGTDQTVIVQQGNHLLQEVVTSVAGTGSSLVIALLLAMFLLASGDLFQRRLVESFPAFPDKRRAFRISRDIERQISRYLAAITLINAGLGTAIGITMHLLGMPYALLWGVAGFLLNFIPYLGAVTGIAVSGAVALVTYDTLGQALLVPLAYLALTSLEGQMITPYLVGRHLRLNTPIVFVAVVFWAWLWGAAGALLAVPFLVLAKVLCDNLPGLRPLGAFLDGGPRARRPGNRRRTRRHRAGVMSGVSPRLPDRAGRGRPGEPKGPGMPPSQPVK